MSQAVLNTNGKQHYLNDFVKLKKKLPGYKRPWISRIRQEAIHSFEELGFPSVRNEQWKYTNVAPLTKIPFELTNEKDLESLSAKDIAPFVFGTQATHQLVFVNGQYSQALSRLEALTDDITLGHLSSFLEDDSRLIKGLLSRRR